MRGRLSGLVVLLAVFATAATLAVVAARGEPTAGTRAEQVHQITSGLRCPVCKDLSAADSPAPLAGQMRQQVAGQLAAGRSAEQIRAGFIAAYGESVLMSPPHSGLGQTAYLLPFVLVGTALLAGALVLRRWRGLPEAAASSPADRSITEAGSTERDPAESVEVDGALSASDRRTVDRALMRLREQEGR